MKRLLIVIAAGIVTGCRTTPAPAPAPAAAPPIEFRPAQSVAPLELTSGRYKDLFAPSSYAIWVTPEVAELKREIDAENEVEADPALDDAAAVIDASLAVFELHLESVFPDMSIAYESVGMRGVETTLLLPDGRKAQALQRVIAGELEEEAAGALKRYRRTNLVLFARKDLFFDRSALTSLAELSLILEAHGTSYRFRWQPIVPEEAELSRSEAAKQSAAHAAKAVQLGFTQFVQRIRPFLHNFD